MTTQTKTTWRKVRLGEAVEIIDGDRGINYPSNGEFFRNGYCLFLNAKNVCGIDFDLSDAQFITKRKDDLLRSGKTQRGDFVLTTRGTVGNIAHYSKEVSYDHVRINSGMVILRPKEDIINENFFHLFLISQEFKNQIDALKSGSAQSQLPIRDLKLFEINLPPLDRQKNIVHMLSPINDKIEFNNKINHNLEQMAQVIFKEWFIKFKFPGHEKAEFMKSELGRIPKEWKIGIFGDFIEELSDKVGGQQDNVTVFSAVRTGKLVPSNEYFKKRVYSKSIANYKKIGKFDFAYNPARINIGSIGMLEDDIRGAVSPIYVVFRVKQSNSHFFFWRLLQTSYVRDYIEKFASGSVRQTVEVRIFRQIPIVIPPIDLIQRFNTIFENLYSKMKLGQKENQKLASLRDLLLPKLMSGEIKV